MKSKPKTSLVIPSYTLTDRLYSVLERTLESYEGMFEEVIVSEDGGKIHPEVMELCDTYIYNKKNVGFTANVNRGWRQATGDFVAIVSSDCYWTGGDINKLFIKGKVTSPKIENQDWVGFSAPFFVVPKTVKEKYGMLREEMVNFSSDHEYRDRISSVFEWVTDVTAHNVGALTITEAGINKQEYYDKDREVYERIQKEA